jgi:hypothetical protein
LLESIEDDRHRFGRDADPAVIGILKVEEVLPDRRFERQSPEIQEDLVRVKETTVPVNDINELAFIV